MYQKIQYQSAFIIYEGAFLIPAINRELPLAECSGIIKGGWGDFLTVSLNGNLLWRCFCHASTAPHISVNQPLLPINVAGFVGDHSLICSNVDADQWKQLGESLIICRYNGSRRSDQASKTSGENIISHCTAFWKNGMRRVLSWQGIWRSCGVWVNNSKWPNFRKWRSLP